jgi:hypothetical protein
MKAKIYRREIAVKLDPSTRSWLLALARKNKTTAAALLAQAAFCFADAAGRRRGSWEADVANSLLVSSGFSASVSDSDFNLCHHLDVQRMNRRKPFAPR